MSTFWYWFIFGTLKLVAAETSIEIEVKHHLTSLEDQVHFPINIYMSAMGILLENLVTNFSNYQLDAEDVLNTYTQRLKVDIDSVSLSDLGIETNCDETTEDNVKHIIKTSDDKIKKIIIDAITQAQRIISDARNVFLVVQNRTNAVKLKVDHCFDLLDDSQCLLEALTTIMLMERTVPKIITIIGHQHETQLALLEDDVISGLEKVIVIAYDSFVEILDDFLVCCLKEDFFV